MPLYRCEAVDLSGEVRVEELEACSDVDAIAKLKDRRFTVLQVVELRDSQNAPIKARAVDPETRVSIDVVLSFYEQLSFLLRSGIPIYLSVKMLTESIQDFKMKELLRVVLFELSEGNPLSGTLQKFPKAFPPFHTHLVAVGEKSGNLELALSDLVDLIREQQEIRERMVKAAAYPLFLAALCFSLVIGLLLFIFPKFESIFESFNVKLPATTEFLLTLSRTLRAQGSSLLVATASAVFAAIVFLRSERASEARDRLWLNIPLVRDLFVSMFVALFAKTLSTLIKSGTPLLEAIHTCQSTISGRYKFKFFEGILRTVRDGESISKATEGSPLVPEMARQLLIIGENTGQMDKMLDNIFAFYKKRYLELLSKLTAVLQPILLFVAAGLIALVAVSLFVPLFKLGANLRSGGS